MLDWWFDTTVNKTVYVLTPAIAGRERAQAPAIPSGRCTFLSAGGLCQLHDAGLKPTEGRLALCQGRTPADLHERIAATWETPVGSDLIKRWEADGERGRCALATSTASAGPKRALKRHL